MGLETATYIDDLVPSNPLSTDAVSQGDDHLRLIKQVLQNSFPDFSSPVRKWRTEAISANETVAVTDDGTFYLVDASGGARTVSLPAASGATGVVIGVKKVDTSNNIITIDPSGSETVDGSTTRTLGIRNDTMWIICDGTGWQIAMDYVSPPPATSTLVKARGVARTNQNIATGMIAGTSWDGLTLVAGDILLLTGQTTESQNGLYIVPAAGAAPRAPGYTTWASLVGTIVVVAEGTNNGDTVWRNKSGISGTLGTTAIVYTQMLTIDDFSSVETDLSRDDYVLGVNGSSGATKLFDVGDLPGTRMLWVRDQKASGTEAAGMSSGWNTRVLNTTVDNSITGASLGSNRITLPSGTYDIDADIPGVFAGGGNQTRNIKAALYNVTDSSYTIIGQNSNIQVSSSGGQIASRVRGRFTITATKSFELRQYWSGGSGKGGADANSGAIEVYAEAIIYKVE